MPDDSNIEAWTDPDMEARLVALVLGEASDFERAELERQMGEQPELEQFHRRIEGLHSLLDGSEAESGDEAWKLPAERRTELLAQLGAEPTAEPSDADTAEVIAIGGAGARKPRQVHWQRFAASAAVIGLVSTVAAVMTLPRMFSPGATSDSKDDSGSIPRVALYREKSAQADRFHEQKRKSTTGGAVVFESSYARTDEGWDRDYDGADVTHAQSAPAPPMKPAPPQEPNLEAPLPRGVAPGGKTYLADAPSPSPPPALRTPALASARPTPSSEPSPEPDAASAPADDPFADLTPSDHEAPEASEPAEIAAAAGPISTEIDQKAGVDLYAGGERRDGAGIPGAEAKWDPQADIFNGFYDAFGSSNANDAGGFGGGGGGFGGPKEFFQMPRIDSTSQYSSWIDPQQPTPEFGVAAGGASIPPRTDPFGRLGDRISGQEFPQSGEWRFSSSDGDERAKSANLEDGRVPDPAAAGFSTASKKEALMDNFGVQLNTGYRFGNAEQAQFGDRLGQGLGQGQGEGKPAAGGSQDPNAIAGIDLEDSRGTLGWFRNGRPASRSSWLLPEDQRSKDQSPFGWNESKFSVPGDGKLGKGTPQPGRFENGLVADAKGDAQRKFSVAGGIEELQPLDEAQEIDANGAVTALAAVVKENEARVEEQAALEEVREETRSRLLERVDQDWITAPQAQKGERLDELGEQKDRLARAGKDLSDAVETPGLLDLSLRQSEWLRANQRGDEHFAEGLESAEEEEMAAQLLAVDGTVLEESIANFELGFRLGPGTSEYAEKKRSYDVDKLKLAEMEAVRDAAKSEPPQSRPAPPARRPAALDLETATAEQPFSTFSLNVSDVSFKLAQNALLENSQWPEADKVRPEEFVNAFDYRDPEPSQSERVACATEQCAHPFLQQRNLLRISMRTAALGRGAGTPLRLTVLLDKSGSMEREDREASVQRAFEALAGQLREGDLITVIGFARTPRLIADRFPAEQGEKLLELVAEAPSEGGTNIEQALKLAAESAQRQFDGRAQNRIVLITDGAANLGDADPQSLQQRVVQLRDAGISFDACGVGADGLNDETLEALTRKGDGRYYFLNRPQDADEGFVRQLAGALRPAAKNVKVQVVFNPQRVRGYRLSGFEKHRLQKEDFRNDAVDAAEMAAEESGNAIYQVEVDPAGNGDLGTVFVRFRDLASGQMVERSWAIPYSADTPRLKDAPASMKLAATAMLLGEKLKTGPVAEGIDLRELAPIAVQLRSGVYRSHQRVQSLVQMLETARDLNQ